MKSLKFYLDKALKENFALGAINFSGMESLQAIISACKKHKSPIIISVSESAMKYMGENWVQAFAKLAKEEFSAIFLHLDHGKSLEICSRAIDLGFDSVMIDGSQLSYEENIAITKQVADYARGKGVLVEGELGQLKGVEDDTFSNEHIFTKPQKAKEFVYATGVDMLAISIGTSHGAYKYKGKQNLRFDILQEIEKFLPDFPLVLHGASTVSPKFLEIINENGGQISEANGNSIDQLQEAVQKHNIVKINTDTDIRLAMTCGVRKFLAENPAEIDPRQYLGASRNEIEKIVSFKIENIFFSKNKI